MHGSTRKPKSTFWALEKGGRNIPPPYFAFCENRVGASLAAQDPMKCAQDAQRAPSGAPSPRRDRARRAGPFHVTWFTFGGGQTARGVTRCRRGIGATDPKPRALPACAYLTRQTQRVRTREGVNVSLVFRCTSWKLVLCSRDKIAAYLGNSYALMRNPGTPMCKDATVPTCLRARHVSN